MSKDKLKNIRREYGELALHRNDLADEPLVQFEIWLNAIVATDNDDPTAMVLATVDEQGQPDTRVVLLKGIDEGDLVFYTNYHSTKAQHISGNARVALNFYWPELARQVRIKGHAQKLSKEMSDAYFASRPQASQLSTIASEQSQVIADRESLQQKLNQLIYEHGQALVMRPEHWGGYRVRPHEFEFWQGRDNRLHDRFRYRRDGDVWQIERLSP